MNWTRALIAGVVGGIAVNIADFIQHGLILGQVYMKYDQVFAQEQANPLYFLLIAVLSGIFAAIIFAKTRTAWAEGAKGGLAFGLLLGLFTFWLPFYNPLVIKDFPYYLSWCWGGINLIDGLIFGLIVGLIYKRPASTAPPEAETA
ncbi:MAG: hypothetical protein R3338_10245 [Thermoanaerobaculia bacterium]|nr:hypothetical protein [Thermoanaerobaculia bacterium]